MQSRPHASAKDYLPSQKELDDRNPIDVIAQSMLERGFSGLWSTPKHVSQFGDFEKRTFLIKLATTGRMCQSAAAAGFSYRTIAHRIQHDEVFAASCEEAKRFFRDLLEGEMYRRGVEGFEEEVLGGKNRDQIFKVKKYSDKMMDSLIRIHMPEMRRENAGSTTVIDNSTKVINNQFDLESMPVEDLAMFKQLLINQQARIEDAEADKKAIDGQ